MIAVTAVAQAVGLRGLLGAAVGAVLVAAPAYQAGKWTEAAAGEERIARVLAEQGIERMEAENAKVDAAVAARLAVGGGADDGRLPDDPYRRD